MRIVVLLALMLSFSSYAFDLSEYGDFSSRSVIMNRLNGVEINQEQKDALSAKKLAPTTECLIAQIKKGNYDNVKLLLDAKVNPNQAYLSEYPIRVAAQHNRFEIVKLLYDNGAKLNKGFFSELYDAVRNKNPEMAKYLIERGANPNYLDSLTSNTTLYMALKNKMYDTATLLIEHGAKPDRRSVMYLKKHKLAHLIPEQ